MYCRDIKPILLQSVEKDLIRTGQDNDGTYYVAIDDLVNLGTDIIPKYVDDPQFLQLFQQFFIGTLEIKTFIQERRI